MLPYDDPVLGHFDFEWEAKVNNRTLLEEGCPFIGNDKVWIGYKDLKSCYPEISEDWHPTRNRNLTPDKVYKGTPKKVWWKFADCGHEWYASVRGRTFGGASCKKCRKTRRYDL